MSNARNLANLLGTNTTIQTAKLADNAVTSAKLPVGSKFSGKNFPWTAQSQHQLNQLYQHGTDWP